jgi:hypothetical protein
LWYVFVVDCVFFVVRCRGLLREMLHWT